MANIIIKNCNLISMDPLRQEVENNIDVLIRDSKIEKIGKNIKKAKAKIIDGEGKYLLPGLINCHAHIPMSLFREISYGHKLIQWLEKDIWPIEAKMTKEDFIDFSALSMVELLRSGCTLFNDMYFETDWIIEAAKKTGIDFIESVTLMDIDGKKRGIERLKKFVEFCKKYPRIKKAVAIHGLYTASGKYIEECVLLAEKMGVNLFHIHFCEYDGEVGMIKAKHKVRHPSEVLMKYFDGLKHNLILAHCVKLDEVDFLNLKKLGAAVSHNPVSNLKLGCGIANITKMKKKGITVGIGTDGQGSCGPLSVLENAKFASLLQKGIQEDPTILTGYEALKLATLDGAKALRLEKTKGSISIGKDADVVLWDLDSIETNPVNEPCADIVFDASSKNVDTVIVRGEILIKNKVNTRVNEQELIKQCDKLLKEIKSR